MNSLDDLTCADLPAADLAVRAALFDFGGVIADEGFRNGLVAMAEEQGLPAPADMLRLGADAIYDSGFILGSGTAADFWSLMRRRTGLHGEDADLTRRILDGFVVRPWMLDLVARLRRAGVLTGILSDQTHWLDELDRRQGFSAGFDRVYNSFHLGKGKRNASLFGDVAADLHMPPGAILFVDDDAGNVRRASEAGFQVIHYVGRHAFEEALARRVPVAG